jgi:retron-type reverse transcriptase
MNTPNFEEIISLENLFHAWREFVKDKKHKKDVMEFSMRLSENIFNLHIDLQNKFYTHGSYQFFKIYDPKPRDIHKASVRDRLLHRAIYRVLYPYFDGKFVFDSYSCRLEKGTHRAVDRLNYFQGKVSKNRAKQCWVLKCDVRKFFASINHGILIQILKRYDLDDNTVWLLQKVIASFNGKTVGQGLPLGNLTSQLLVNVFMNEFDQYMKHILKIKYYIRYADDFVILQNIVFNKLYSQ